jgi:uncharacterized protein YraI
MDHQTSAMSTLRRACSLAVLAGAALAIPAAAQAQQAFTARTVNLRAGPGTEYPIVVVLGQGFPLEVQGCLQDYRWCDVLAGPNRGWMYGGNISYAYQNSYVPLLNYGTVLGIGLLGFALDDYWGSHYRDRPWYGDRERDHWRRYEAPRFVTPAPRDRGGQRPYVRPPQPPHAQPPAPIPGGQRPHPQGEQPRSRSVQPAQPVPDRRLIPRDLKRPEQNP